MILLGSILTTLNIFRQGLESIKDKSRDFQNPFVIALNYGLLFAIILTRSFDKFNFIKVFSLMTFVTSLEAIKLIVNG